MRCRPWSPQPDYNIATFYSRFLCLTGLPHVSSCTASWPAIRGSSWLSKLSVHVLYNDVTRRVCDVDVWMSDATWNWLIGFSYQCVRNEETDEYSASHSSFSRWGRSFICLYRIGLSSFAYGLSHWEKLLMPFFISLYARQVHWIQWLAESVRGPILMTARLDHNTLSIWNRL